MNKQQNNANANNNNNGGDGWEVVVPGHDKAVAVAVAADNAGGVGGGVIGGRNDWLDEAKNEEEDGDNRKIFERGVEGGDLEEDKELKFIDSFDKLELKDDLLRGIYAYGFEKPSMIQGKAINPIISGRDVIAQAQSGTGKTAAFSISALQLIDETKTVCQALVITPVRELANQSCGVMTGLGAVMNVKCACFVGGDPSQTESHNKIVIDKGIHAAVGTPGRLQSLVKRGLLKLDHVKLLIIDEADEMLKEGHTDNLKFVVGMLPPGAKIALFSATMPAEVLETSRRFLNDPVRILVKKQEVALQGLKQFRVCLDQENQKLLCLLDLLSQLTFQQCIIFGNSIDKVSWLAEQLSRENHMVAIVHSAMDQRDRNAACEDFKTGKARILTATDVLARGFDVQQVSLVINYDVPNCRERGARENYIHRIGRAARMGRKGIAINLCRGRNDDANLQDIMHYYHCDIKDLPADLVAISADTFE